MVPLLQHLEYLNPSLGLVSVVTGLALGSVVGNRLPTIDLRSLWQE